MPLAVSQIPALCNRSAVDNYVVEPAVPTTRDQFTKCSFDILTLRRYRTSVMVVVPTPCLFLRWNDVVVVTEVSESVTSAEIVAEQLLQPGVAVLDRVLRDDLWPPPHDRSILVAVAPVPLDLIDQLIFPGLAQGTSTEALIPVFPLVGPGTNALIVCVTRTTMDSGTILPSALTVLARKDGPHHIAALFLAVRRHDEFLSKAGLSR